MVVAITAISFSQIRVTHHQRAKPAIVPKMAVFQRFSCRGLFRKEAGSTLFDRQVAARIANLGDLRITPDKSFTIARSHLPSIE